jgi:hypothetical protein
VVSTAVLVAQIVSVLPDIHAEERTKTLYYGVAAVRLLRDDQFAIFLSSKPSPTRSEERRASVEELLLEGFEATPLSDNSIEELPRRLAALIRCELREVKVVIEELPCVVEDRTFALANEFFKRKLSIFGAFDEAIQRIDIASEVLTVVEGKGLCTDSRLEGIGFVRELDEFVLHQRNSYWEVIKSTKGRQALDLALLRV